MESEGVDLANPRAVGVTMKDSNVLTYHMELDKYMMLSRYHEVALRTYEPILPLPSMDIADEIKKLKMNLLKLQSQRRICQSCRAVRGALISLFGSEVVRRGMLNTSFRLTIIVSILLFEKI